MQWFPNAPMLGYFMTMEQLDFERMKNKDKSMVKENDTILEKDKLNLIVEYLSTVLECTENTDYDKVSKLDALRVSRHKAVCEAFNVDYNSYRKHEFEINDFTEDKLNRLFDGKIEEAAKYIYRWHIDKSNEPGNSIKTKYAWFFLYVKDMKL